MGLVKTRRLMAMAKQQRAKAALKLPHRFSRKTSKKNFNQERSK